MTNIARLAIMSAAVLLTARASVAQLNIVGEERIVFYGDSLVYPDGFGTMVENFVRAKYPESRAKFWQVALPGPNLAKTGEAAARFDELVAPLRPTTVVICCGLGDGDLKGESPARASMAAANMATMLKKCRDLGARAFVLTPPLPTVSKKNIFMVTQYDQAIAKIAEAIVAAAKENGADVLDWYASLVKLQDEGHPTDLTKRDGLTPSPLSQSVAAKLVMDAFQLEPIDVRIKVDWSARSASSSVGTVEVNGIGDTMLRLTLRGFALPLFTGKRQAAFRESFAVATYCRMMLTVDHFPGGALSISSPGARRKPTVVPADVLRSGYNLAEARPVAMAEAVVALADRIETKNRAFSAIMRFRRELADHPPEPELRESFETQLLSRVQYHDGAVAIIARTPRAMDVTIDLRLVASKEAQP